MPSPSGPPTFALLLTSPPYGSFRDESLVDDAVTYTADARAVFASLQRLLAPGAAVVVEVSQVRHAGRTRPVVWRIGQALEGIFTFVEDIARVNTGPAEAGPGYDHSHLLVFRNS